MTSLRVGKIAEILTDYPTTMSHIVEGKSPSTIHYLSTSHYSPLLLMMVQNRFALALLQNLHWLFQSQGAAE